VTPILGCRFRAEFRLMRDCPTCRTWRQVRFALPNHSRPAFLVNLNRQIEGTTGVNPIVQWTPLYDGIFDTEAGESFVAEMLALASKR
jgi:hypothetical protein